MSFFRKIRLGRQFNLADSLPEFESPAQMAAERDIRVRALLKSKSKASRNLGHKIASCGKRTPCGSAACPLCSHYFRQWSFAECAHLSSKYKPVIMVTYLMYSEMMTDKALFTFDFQKLFLRLRKQLQRSGFKRAVIGYLEFDYHAESSLWLPHFHLMVLGDDPAIETFRDRYCRKQRRQGSTKISRPLHVSNLKDVVRQLSYLCKSFCSRVEAYLDGNGKRKTKKYRLRPSQLRLSLRVFDRLGFTGRLFLYRARRVGSEIRVTSCL